MPQQDDDCYQKETKGDHPQNLPRLGTAKRLTPEGERHRRLRDALLKHANNSRIQEGHLGGRKVHKHPIVVAIHDEVLRALKIAQGRSPTQESRKDASKDRQKTGHRNHRGKRLSRDPRSRRRTYDQKHTRLPEKDTSNWRQKEKDSNSWRQRAKEERKLVHLKSHSLELRNGLWYATSRKWGETFLVAIKVSHSQAKQLLVQAEKDWIAVETADAKEKPKKYMHGSRTTA